MIALRFKAVNGKYVSAQNGGGSTLVASASVAAAWETFPINDLDTAQLSSADHIQLRAYNGQWVCADNGGGSTISANRAAPGAWETFVIECGSGGTIVNGAVVTLRASNGNFVCAENGGASPLVANRTSAGAWEQFLVEFVYLPQKLLSLGGDGWVYGGGYLDEYGGSIGGTRDYLSGPAASTGFVKIWVSWWAMQQSWGGAAGSMFDSWAQLNSGQGSAPPPGVVATLRDLDKQIQKANADGKAVILTVEHYYPTWASTTTSDEATLAAGRDRRQRLPSAVTSGSPFSWFLAHLMARYSLTGAINDPGPQSSNWFGNPVGAWVNAIEVCNEPNLNVYPQPGIQTVVSDMMKCADDLWYLMNYYYGKFPPMILGPGTLDSLASDKPAYSDSNKLSPFDYFTAAVLNALAGRQWHAYVAWSHHTYSDTKNDSISRLANVVALLKSFGWPTRANVWLTEGGYVMTDGSTTQLNLQASKIAGTFNRFKTVPQAYTIAQHSYNNPDFNHANYQSGLQEWYVDDQAHTQTLSVQRPSKATWASL